MEVQDLTNDQQVLKDNRIVMIIVNSGKYPNLCPGYGKFPDDDDTLLLLTR